LRITKIGDDEMIKLIKDEVMFKIDDVLRIRHSELGTFLCRVINLDSKIMQVDKSERFLKETDFIMHEHYEILLNYGNYKEFVE